nr:MAG TPA: hypothetical protein [Caudoviricetes sp.]
MIAVASSLEIEDIKSLKFFKTLILLSLPV